MENKHINAVDKAKQLVQMFMPLTNVSGDNCFANEAYTINKNQAKLAAIIAVDEVLSLVSTYNGMHDQEFLDADKQFYQEVKKQIEKPC